MRRTLPIAALALALIPQAVAAEPLEIETIEVEMVESGDDVIVVARGAVVGEATVHHRGDRLEVDLAGKPDALAVPLEDETLRRIDVRVRSNGQRRLSIQLRMSRTQARRLAATARVAQIGDDLQVVVSRDPSRAPMAAFQASVDVEKIRVDPSPEAPATPDDGDGALEMPSDDDDESIGAVGLQSASEGGRGVGLGLLLLAMLAAGGLYWRFKRKRRGPESVVGINILSVRQLGAKSRIILLAVGRREILLSVSSAGSQVLARWENELAPPLAPPLAAPREPNRAPDQAHGAPNAFAHRDFPHRPNGVVRSWRASTPPPQADRHLALAPDEPRRTRYPTAKDNGERATGLSSTDDYAAYAALADQQSVKRDRRGTSPAIRGILELRDQTLSLDNVLGSETDASTEWDQALASGTQAGRLR